MSNNPDIQHITQYLGAGAGITQDGHLVQGIEPGDTTVVEHQGRGYGSQQGTIWHPKRSAERQRVRAPYVYRPLPEILPKYIYVVDYWNHRVRKHTLDGAYVSTHGSSGSGQGQFTNPYAIAVSKNYKTIYVTDGGNYRVQKFDSGWSFLVEWGEQGSEEGQFNTCYYIAVSNDDMVYVTDSQNHRVQKFDANGNFLLEWGEFSSGYAPGKFSGPGGIVVDDTDNNNVLVVDIWHGCIQKFTSTGTWLATWGLEEGLGALNGLGKDSNGNFYVSETQPDDCIHKFDHEGNYLTSFGEYGLGNGQFREPSGVGVDGNDCVWVADWNNARVQKFETTGQYLLKFAGVTKPHGVAFTAK